MLAVLFGIGAGLTLDEFALWLHLEDVYWTDEGRQSVDAVIVAALIGGLVVAGLALAPSCRWWRSSAPSESRTPPRPGLAAATRPADAGASARRCVPSAFAARRSRVLDLIGGAPTER